jgi:hypothetical protein
METGNVYSVHGYYGKLNSRKTHQKIEALVFAKTANQAENIVRDLFDRYPADIEYITVAGGQIENGESIYARHPELEGMNPDTGYLYNAFSHQSAIYKYFK